MTESSEAGGPSSPLDARYGVPIIDHGTTRPTGVLGEAIHRLHLQNGRTLDWYAKLEPAETLHVTLQGAIPPGKDRYPRFQRVASMKDRVPALIALADPTFQLSDDERFRIGWYAGGPGFDPVPEVEALVRDVMTAVGATRVMFIGGSAGGMGAMRLAPRFPGSLALVTDPQSNIDRYSVKHRDNYFECCWPGRVREEVLASEPHRFNAIALWSETDPDCFLYYRQSTRDYEHVIEHARPMMRALNVVDGTTANGRVRFVLERGEHIGHGVISAAEYDRTFDNATTFWNEALHPASP